MTQTVQQFAPDTLPVVTTRPSPAALVSSLAIPRILAGEAADVVELVVTQPEFGECKPLLLAAAALARNWLDIAESALAKGNSELAQLADPPAAHALSAAMITVALARLHDHGAVGLEYTDKARQLMIKL